MKTYAAKLLKAHALIETAVWVCALGLQARAPTPAPQLGAPPEIEGSLPDAVTPSSRTDRFLEFTTEFFLADGITFAIAATVL